MKKNLVKTLAMALGLVSMCTMLPAIAGAVDTEASIQFRPGTLTLVVPDAGDPDRRPDLDFGTNDVPIDSDVLYPVIAPDGTEPYAIYVEDTRANGSNGWRLQAALSDFSVTLGTGDEAEESTFPATIYFTGTEIEGQYPLEGEELTEIDLSDTITLPSENHSSLGVGAGTLQYVNVATTTETVRRNLFYIRWDVPGGDATIDLQIDPAFDLRELVTGERYVGTIYWVLNEQMTARL